MISDLKVGAFGNCGGALYLDLLFYLQEGISLILIISRKEHLM